jgi:hypothetical protein
MVKHRNIFPYSARQYKNKNTETKSRSSAWDAFLSSFPVTRLLNKSRNSTVLWSDIQGGLVNIPVNGAERCTPGSNISLLLILSSYFLSLPSHFLFLQCSITIHSASLVPLYQLRSLRDVDFGAPTARKYCVFQIEVIKYIYSIYIYIYQIINSL